MKEIRDKIGIKGRMISFGYCFQRLMSMVIWLCGFWSCDQVKHYNKESVVELISVKRGWGGKRGRERTGERECVEENERVSRKEKEQGEELQRERGIGNKDQNEVCPQGHGPSSSSCTSTS